MSSLCKVEKICGKPQPLLFPPPCKNQSKTKVDFQMSHLVCDWLSDLMLVDNYAVHIRQ